MTIDQVCEFIATAKPHQLPRLMRALRESVSDYIGCAVGVEDYLVLVEAQLKAEGE